jgi:hypothetical protein
VVGDQKGSALLALSFKFWRLKRITHSPSHPYETCVADICSYTPEHGHKVHGRKAIRKNIIQVKPGVILLSGVMWPGTSLALMRLRPGDTQATGDLRAGRHSDTL